MYVLVIAYSVYHTRPRAESAATRNQKKKTTSTSRFYRVVAHTRKPFKYLLVVFVKGPDLSALSAFIDMRNGINIRTASRLGGCQKIACPPAPSPLSPPPPPPSTHTLDVIYLFNIQQVSHLPHLSFSQLPAGHPTHSQSHHSLHTLVETTLGWGLPNRGSRWCIDNSNAIQVYQ